MTAFYFFSQTHNLRLGEGNFIKEKITVHVEITYNKITDWTIAVYQKGRADDYPGTPRDGADAVLAYEQDLDMELCFARAHVAVKNWLNEFNDGY